MSGAICANIDAKVIENITPFEFIKIKKPCDNSHKHCLAICERAKSKYKEITQGYFDEFLTLIKGNNYSNLCVSSYSNKRHDEVKKFITECSKYLIVSQWDSIIAHFVDWELNAIIKNQFALNPTLFTEAMIGTDITLGNYGGKTNVINGMISQPIKIQSFETMILSMKLGQFSRFLNKMTKGSNQLVDNIIIKYIDLNKQEFTLSANKEIGIKIINNFIAKPQIVKSVYKLVSHLIEPAQKMEIFNKSVLSNDRDLIISMLEKKDIVPNADTIAILTSRCYCRPEGAAQSRQVAEFIDLFCEYGLVITKPIIIAMLDRGCYVNNLEKHGISVDSPILAKCASVSYYPYKFNIVPDTHILLTECAKHDNLATIKKLREFGGAYTSACLEEACKIPKNGKTIKYLMLECGVKTTEKCLEYFQEAYKIEALDVLMKKFKSEHPELVKNDLENKRILSIDENSIMNVKPREVKPGGTKIDRENDTLEYQLRGKIKKFFELKKNTIRYSELYQVVLKYLISNKLIIGNYFVISEKLSELLKMNYCTIMHIDQLHNILTYFIE